MNDIQRYILPGTTAISLDFVSRFHLNSQLEVSRLQRPESKQNIDMFIDD